MEAFMDFDLEFLDLPEVTGLDPVNYQYFNQLLRNRTVVFNKDIDESIIERVYLPLKDFEEDDSLLPVTLIINSPGGSVSDSFFLAYYLENYKKKLNIIVTGCAASMATVILAGGSKNKNVHRVCYPSTYALIHDGYITLNPSESKTAGDIMAFNDKIDKDIREFILTRTKIPPEQYDSQSRHQWFITAKEMLDYGLVDEIIGSGD